MNNQSFLPSEILHSRDLSSACTFASPSSGDEGHEIIICHKDRTSFYKATRKAKRTAQRIWSACSNSASGDVSTSSDACSCSCDGYFVGKTQPANSSDDASAATIKRLRTEFGTDSGIDTILEDISVTITGFSSREDSGEQTDSTNFNVVFFDLDAVSPVNMHDSSTQKIQFDFMQKSLSMLQNKGKNAVIHIRSESMYRIITSIGPGSSRITEIEQYFLSKQNESEEAEKATNDNRGKVDGTVIRRLCGKKAANCPLTIYPARYVELPYTSTSSSGDGDQAQIIVEICRFHNYDADRGCLRSKRAQQNSEVKDCDLDHGHCHRCGGQHRAFECPDGNELDDLSSVVFRKDEGGNIIATPYDGSGAILHPEQAKASMPALLVLAGRLRGRTLATCELLPLSTSSNGTYKQQWKALPNLHEHRGSHAACSPNGSGLAFVMGGGTADGNSDAVEILNFCENKSGDWRWKMMAGKLSSPRHAFGAVSCATVKKSSEQTGMKSVSLYAVGGWQYGSLSCESMERLTFEYPGIAHTPNQRLDVKWLHNEAQWEQCAPLLLSRRLHAVAKSTDDKSIFVFGGYIDERGTTNSIERYDIETDAWTSAGELPFGGHNCPLVQAIAYNDGFLVFPFSTLSSDQADDDAPLVLNYRPGSETLFSPLDFPDSDMKHQLRLPLANWHSFAVTSSHSLNKLFLVGGTIKGKWTDRCWELDLDRLEFNELPPCPSARRRLATMVLE